MRVYVKAGKGGVGKTTMSVGLALHLASRGEKTCIIDYDGGHCVARTLRIGNGIVSNVVQELLPNLSVAIIDNVPYTDIVQSKEAKRKLATYLEQFPGDLGFVPLADMVNAFFGVPTDVPSLEKFSILVRMLHELQANGFAHVVIDVEPTAGLQRLLSNAATMARSIRNLSDQGRLKLAMIGVNWPDITGYLKSDYITEACWYADRIEAAVKMIQNATYLIVSTPEAEPVNQVFEVKKIIERFGGKVSGFVVNGLRGEPHELHNINLLRASGATVCTIERRKELHADAQEDRLKVLSEIGKTVATQFKV